MQYVTISDIVTRLHEILFFYWMKQDDDLTLLLHDVFCKLAKYFVLVRGNVD